MAGSSSAGIKSSKSNKTATIEIQRKQTHACGSRLTGMKNMLKETLSICKICSTAKVKVMMMTVMIMHSTTSYSGFERASARMIYSRFSSMMFLRGSWLVFWTSASSSPVRTTSNSSNHRTRGPSTYSWVLLQHTCTLPIANATIFTSLKNFINRLLETKATAYPSWRSRMQMHITRRLRNWWRAGMVAFLSHGQRSRFGKRKWNRKKVNMTVTSRVVRRALVSSATMFCRRGSGTTTTRSDGALYS